MIRCIALDDEPLALDVIKHYCNKIDDIELVDCFTNCFDALQFIKENEIDLIFLDINMPNMSGIDVAKLLGDSITVIFTTAYQNYAIEGFELDALDYILKPFSFNRFTKSIERAITKHSFLELKNESKSDSDTNSFMMIRSDYATVRVDFSSIICIEGLKDYVKIYTEEKNHITKLTMKSVEQKLKNHGFMRIHKSYVVNLSKIISFEGGQVHLLKNITVSVGNLYKAQFMEYIQKNKA